MITLEWDIPFVLQTPAGNLVFNDLASDGTDPLGYFLLVPDLCKAGVARRVTRTNLAQADGEITHRKFKSGYVVQLTAQLWASRSPDLPATRGDLRAMGDYLAKVLNSIDNEDGALVFTPSAREGETILPRQLQPVRVLGPSGEGTTGFVTIVVEKDSEGPLTTVTFALISPLPYALGTDGPAEGTPLEDGVPAIIHNDGSAEFYPVVWVNGPTTSFTLTNLSNLDEQGNPLEIDYIGAANPGGESIADGHFVEFLFFQNTAYLDRDQDNLKPGINIPASDFWTLVPGPNEILLSGATGTIFWESAFA